MAHSTTLTLFLVTLLSTQEFALGGNYKGYYDCGPIEFCLSTAGRRFLTNLPRFDWHPSPDEQGTLFYDTCTKTAVLNAKVYPENGDDVSLDLNAVFTNPVKSVDECFCHQEFGANYTDIQEQCDQKFYRESGSTQPFCPKCELDQCNIAAENRPDNGAPDPIYANWIFYQNTTGMVTGSGIPLFHKLLEDRYRLVPTLEGDKCTIDTTNYPLPQLYCTNPFDVEGQLGYGVNGKDQNCGMSFWFRCLEDGNFPKRAAFDVNFDFVPCN